MSMTQTLAPHLPYLRRYARALTGSQSSGDAHVRAALTALLEGDESLTEGVPPRVALYRLFHAIWQSGAEHYDEEISGEGGKTPENRLRSLSASKRAALLLTAVEAAESGVEATAQMKPRLGRSSYLGDRVLGHPDPGAKAVAIWLRATLEALFPL